MSLELPANKFARKLQPGIYKTDLFNRKPIFAVKESSYFKKSNYCLFNSWEDAFSIKNSVNLDDINKKYVAALVSGYPNSNLSPYLFIKRLPRANHVLLKTDGTYENFEYDPFSGGIKQFKERIKFFEFIKVSLSQKIKKIVDEKKGYIGIEHSSGLDSNSILSLLRFELNIKPESIHTWSNYGSGEMPLIHEFQKYYELLPSNCHEFNNDKLDLDFFKSDIDRMIQIFGFQPQIGGMVSKYNKLSEVGCKNLFSGLGGDQCLSNNACNVLTSFVNQGRILDLYNWNSNLISTLKILVSRFYANANRAWAENKIKHDKFRTRKNNILIESLTNEGDKALKAHIKINYPYEIDYYLDHYTSIKKRISNDWLSVRLEDEKKMANYFGIVMNHPLLDEFLIASCLNQKLEVFGNSFRDGRLILRSAFNNTLPEFLRVNPSKKRDMNFNDYNEALKRSARYLELFIQESKDWHELIKKWWDLDLINQKAEEFLNYEFNPKIDSNNDNIFLLVDTLNFQDAFLTLLKLNTWFSKLD